MRNDDESILGRSWPGLPTIALGIAWQGTCENYDTAGLWKNKKRKIGGRRVRRQRELRKGRRTVIRMGTLNAGTMTGREERVGRHDEAKESRCTVPTGSKVERE